jgi:hypothetical protein
MKNRTLRLAAAAGCTVCVATAFAEDERPGQGKLTARAIEWSQIAHEMRHELAAEWLPEFRRQLATPAGVRAQQAIDEIRRGIPQPRWEVPPPPRAAARAGDMLANTPAAMVTDDDPGGFYSPRAWPNFEVPYAFDEDMVDNFFFSGAVTGENLGPEEFSSANGLPTTIAALLIIEEQLEDFVDSNGVPYEIKFVGYNPDIHDRVLVFSSISIDPAFVGDYLGTGGEPDDLNGLPACLNNIDGYGAPTVQQDGDFEDIPARTSTLCTWSNIGHQARNAAHALGLFWHQSRPDRDQFITIDPSNIIPQLAGFPVSIAGTGINDGPLQWTTDPITAFRSVGGYDPFSIVHQDAFSFSVNTLPVYEFTTAALNTPGVISENLRRAATVPPTPPVTTTSELLTLAGFQAIFSEGDLIAIEDLYNSDFWYLGRAAGCPTDVNGDGFQNFLDRADFVTIAQTSGTADDVSFQADVNVDGDVDEFDYAAFDGTFVAGECGDDPLDPVIPNGCDFDVDNDGDQDFDDRLAVITAAFPTYVNGSFPPVASRDVELGDFTFNGILDANDLAAFSARFEDGQCQRGQGAPISTGCAFDIDADGDQDFDDQRLFFDLFALGSPVTDLDFNGILDNDDVAAFNAAFISGTCESGNTEPVPNGCDFDLNNDGEQNFQDRLLFGDLWEAGDPVTDLDGDGITGEPDDLGLFATTFTTGTCVRAQTEPQPDGCPLDVNGDDKQNFTDLSLYLQLWQAGEPGTELDGDGILSIGDPQTFVGQFVPGFCSPLTPDPDPGNRPDANVIRPG